MTTKQTQNQNQSGMNYSYIEYREAGNTTFNLPSFGAYLAMEKAMKKNESSANGFRFTFDNPESCLYWMKSATEHLSLFKFSNVKAWKKLFDCHVKIEPLTD